MTVLIAYLPYIQMVLAILMIATILVQHSEAGTGGAFGGNDNWNAGYHTRRGFEKILFNTTIILAVLFAVSSLIAVLFK